VDTKARELLSADDEISEDARSVSASDGFDLSSLSQSQLQQLQEALAARMSAQPENHRTDDASDDFEEEDDFEDDNDE
jgi:conjugal transfer/entry exclusion protein